MNAPPPHRRAAPRWVAPLCEYGPLAAFFVAYLRWDLMVATAVLIATALLALGLSFWKSRRLPWMPVITAGVVALFGGLTLWFSDETFIKMKPTIVQLLFAAILFGGVALRRPVLKTLLGNAWPMDDAGWRRLSFRFAVFFLAMAGLNEAVWRTQSTDVWVAFKVFGLLGLTLLFTLAQLPLMQRHHLPDGAVAASAAERRNAGPKD
jgi:intracellular septation protein